MVFSGVCVAPIRVVRRGTPFLEVQFPCIVLFQEYYNEKSTSRNLKHTLK